MESALIADGCLDQRNRTVLDLRFKLRNNIVQVFEVGLARQLNSLPVVFLYFTSSSHFFFTPLSLLSLLSYFFLWYLYLVFLPFILISSYYLATHSPRHNHLLWGSFKSRSGSRGSMTYAVHSDRLTQQFTQTNIHGSLAFFYLHLLHFSTPNPSRVILTI